jgi:cation-transporting ATPase 13A3/4/5
MDTTAGTDVSVPGNALHQRNYCVAVTGDVFRWMIDFENEDVLNRVSRSQYSTVNMETR